MRSATYRSSPSSLGPGPAPVSYTHLDVYKRQDLSGAAIDEETVRRVERAATALDLARSQQEADSAHLTVELLADGAPVLVDGVPLGLAPGRSHELLSLIHI